MTVSVVIALMSLGSPFHSTGPATPKALLLMTAQLLMAMGVIYVDIDRGVACRTHVRRCFHIDLTKK